MRQAQVAVLVLVGACTGMTACADSARSGATAAGPTNAPNQMGDGRDGNNPSDVPRAIGRGSGEVGGDEVGGSDDPVLDPGASDPATGSAIGPEDASDASDDEPIYELRLHDDPPPVTLEMTRAELAAVFGERARDVLLLEVDPTALLTKSFERIVDACGSSWRQDNPDPRHDCSATELGRSFAGPDGNWQTSSEYALVRILTMTPANVDVSGTSSESLRQLADILGIGGGYSQILADALGIARTDPIVSTAELVDAFKAHVVASHPNIGGEGKLAITLEDALTDLATLAERYGPSHGHPGVVDPSLPPSGAVFGADFRLRIVASSNLRQCDGIDAGTGQRVVSVAADETGPSFEDELEFDFEDPETFGMTGLVANPTVDLRLRARESERFVPSCLGARCQANSPTTPIGPSSVWAIDPWLIEYNIATAARRQYFDRTFDGRYLLGLATVSLGRAPAPPGWMAYDLPLNLGNAPEDQYVWETILEVAQVALHDTPFASIPEGDADVVFTLDDVPIGLTAAELEQKVRPYLQEQNSRLSDVLLAGSATNAGSVDFYYCRADDGAPYLFFVAEADMNDGEPYGYAHPGFFGTSALDEKLSSIAIPGLSDAIHEKLALGAGETIVYFEDDGGVVYRARIIRDTASNDLEIRLAAR